jgi:hypothetical protein
VNRAIYSTSLQPPGAKDAPDSITSCRMMLFLMSCHCIASCGQRARSRRIYIRDMMLIIMNHDSSCYRNNRDGKCLQWLEHTAAISGYHVIMRTKQSDRRPRRRVSFAFASSGTLCFVDCIPVFCCVVSIPLFGNAPRSFIPNRVLMHEMTEMPLPAEAQPAPSGHQNRRTVGGAGQSS